MVTASLPASFYPLATDPEPLRIEAEPRAQRPEVDAEIDRIVRVTGRALTSAIGSGDGARKVLSNM